MFETDQREGRSVLRRLCAQDSEPKEGDGMSEPNERIAATWTDDCSGKKDYDSELVYLSTRYWPRGGGFYTGEPGGKFRPSVETNHDVKPSAHAAIAICLADHDAIELAAAEFEGESFAEVSAQVEEWADLQFRRVVAAMRAEFGVIS
jgi:hypothetical protein